MDTVSRGCGALPLLLLVLLAALESSSRIEHPPEQALLSLDRLTLQPSCIQPPGKLGSLIGHVARSGDVSLSPQFLQFLSERALLGRQPLKLFPDCAAPSHRQHAGSLLPEAPLLLSEFRELLQGFRQSRPRLRAGDISPGP